MHESELRKQVDTVRERESEASTGFSQQEDLNPYNSFVTDAVTDCENRLFHGTHCLSLSL